MRVLTVGVLAMIAITSTFSQEKPKPAPTQSVLEAQARTIADLAVQIKNLQLRLQSLELGEQQRSSKMSKPNLSEIKFELAHFDCTDEFNKAAALALQTRESVTTYQGAGAMNCIQRLGKIVQRVVEALDVQQ